MVQKGAGTVVRSTLRAVPATGPDPFLNHVDFPALFASLAEINPRSQEATAAVGLAVEGVPAEKAGGSRKQSIGRGGKMLSGDHSFTGGRSRYA